MHRLKTVKPESEQDAILIEPQKKEFMPRTHFPPRPVLIPREILRRV
jgi:hypothetical protein